MNAPSFMLEKPNADFTMVCNALLRDKSISLRAKGLYALMFSKPNGWVFHEAALLNESTEGRDALRAAMKELLGARWIEKRQPRDGGQFRGNIFRMCLTVDWKSDDGETGAGNSTPSNTDETKTDEVIPSVSPQPTKATKRGPLPLTSLAEIIGDGEVLPAEWANAVSSKYAPAFGATQQWIDGQWERFCNHHIGKGTKWRDWRRAWLNWCAGSKERSGSRSNGAIAGGGLAAAMRSSFLARNGGAQPGSTVSGGQGTDAPGSDGGGESNRLPVGEIPF